MTGVMAKVDALAARIADLKDARLLAQQVQVREALTRTELAQALTEALAARAELAGRLRRQALLRLAERRPPPRARRGRPSRAIERLLPRLGSLGQALIIARSGLWSGTGRAVFDLRHMAAYARRGGDPGAAPPAPVAQAWYVEAYPDTRRMAPLVHYIVAGAAEGRSPHPLFDAGWYAGQNAAALAGLTPLQHYVAEGVAQGRNPHPLFDLAHYLAQGPDLGPGEDPAVHYVRVGWEQGLSPHPLFDPAWYGAQAPQAAGQPGLLHYLEEGWREGLSPHPLFEPAWYLEQNPDIGATGLEPLSHFVTAGGAEGRNPSPWFDCARYVAQRGGAKPDGANPLVDYLQGGAWALGEAQPGQATVACIAANPEIARAGLTPLEYWARRARRS